MEGEEREGEPEGWRSGAGSLKLMDPDEPDMANPGLDWRGGREILPCRTAEWNSSSFALIGSKYKYKYKYKS